MTQLKNAILVNFKRREVEYVDKGANMSQFSRKLMDNRLLVEYSYFVSGKILFSNNQNEKRKVNFKLMDLLYDPKDAYLMLLLHLNEEFDDDLLFDSIDLLE